MPEGADWFIWRLVVHPRIQESKQDIEENWTLEEVEIAHQVLDALEEAEEKANGSDS